MFRFRDVKLTGPRVLINVGYFACHFGELLDAVPVTPVPSIASLQTNFAERSEACPV